MDDPYSVYKEIHKNNCSNQKLKGKYEIDKVLNSLGFKPNRVTKDSWKNMFTELDRTYFESKLANKTLIQYHSKSKVLLLKSTNFFFRRYIK